MSSNGMSSGWKGAWRELGAKVSRDQWVNCGIVARRLRKSQPHSASGSVFDEVIQLLPLDLVRRDATMEGHLDEGMSKEGPLAAGTNSVESLAELTRA